MDKKKGRKEGKKEERWNRISELVLIIACLHVSILPRDAIWEGREWEGRENGGKEGRGEGVKRR